jgi:plasmid stabilization system protein ParE
MPRALRALYAIADVIAVDDPAAAARWIARVIDQVEKAAVIPLAGRIVPELARDERPRDVRWSLPHSYRVRGRVVQVLFVFHGHARWPAHVAKRRAR